MTASTAKSDDGSEISTTDQKVLATVFLQLEQSAAVSQSTGKIPNAIKLAHAINLIDSVLARLVLDPKTAKEVQSSLAALKKLIR